MNIALANTAVRQRDHFVSVDAFIVNSRVKTFVINLDRAADRLAVMEERLAELGLFFERVAAVDGGQLAFPTPGYDEAGYRRLHGKRTNPAEVGCYLSHIECARRLLASDATHALILEDDLVFAEDFCELTVAALDAARDWDLLRLSTVNAGPKYSFKTITARRSLAIALTREKGSGAYIINRRAARWLVEKLMPMRLPYDIALDLEFLDGLRAAFVEPVPVSQSSDFPTQIQNGRRQHRIAGWRRITVYLYRAWIEANRLAARLHRLISLRRSRG